MLSTEQMTLSNMQELFTKHPDIYKFIWRKHLSVDPQTLDTKILDICDQLDAGTFDRENYRDCQNLLEIIIDDYTNYYLLPYYHNGYWNDMTFYSFALDGESDGPPEELVLPTETMTLSNMGELFRKYPGIYEFIWRKHLSANPQILDIKVLDVCDQLTSGRFKSENYRDSQDLLEIIIDDYTNYYQVPYYHNGIWNDLNFCSYADNADLV